MKTRIALLLLLAGVAHAADTNPETACRTHLRNLGGAVKAYALLHDNKSPAKLSVLYLEGLVDSLGDFVCPASGVSITMASEIDAKSNYELGSGDVLIREKAARHDGQALAVFADGSIRAVEGAPPPAVSVSPEPATPAPTASVIRPATPAAPTTVMRDATPPVAKPATPAGEEKPVLEVAKPDPGIQLDLETGFDFSEMLGVTFAFQADGKLVIGSVNADSIGADMGFKAGDTVVEINEKPAPKGKGDARTVTGEELARLAGVSPGQSLLVTIEKADKEKVTFSLMTGLPNLRGQ